STYLLYAAWHVLGDEVIDLYLSSKGIHPDKQSNTGLKVENAILKFEKNISSKHNDDLQKVQERFYFDREPWWGERAEVPCLDTLIKSTWQTSKIEIKYRKVDGNISSRIIRPYGIVVKRMDWYLIGYCEKSQNMRTFKCERILESIIIDSTFSIPDNFSLENYWQKSQGLFKRNCEEKEKYPVKIKVNKTYMQILEKFEVFTLDHRGGFVIASVNMHKYDFACTEVKEIIGLVEVMEPEEIRLYARKELNKLVKKYTDIEK
ncbi:MAG: helix-turn-helix transcriptional regulator, partial [Halanaerobiales bacterium]